MMKTNIGFSEHCELLLREIKTAIEIQHCDTVALAYMFSIIDKKIIEDGNLPVVDRAMLLGTSAIAKASYKYNFFNKHGKSKRKMIHRYGIRRTRSFDMLEDSSSVESNSEDGDFGNN